MPTTRFAPSPTGFLHLGHAYSAWFSHRASAGGRFLLRIEDIDQTRARPEFIEAIFEDLAWIGLDWASPVRVQSEHFSDYHVALEKLREFVYPCFCTRADIKREIEGAANAPHGPDGPLYPGTCRTLTKAERDARSQDEEPFALRLDTERALRHTGGLTWRDVRAGLQEAHPLLFGDVVIARKETPTSYHLSVVVDDALQGVDLVTRGQDLFEATHVHRLLQALLGLDTPEYWHHPLIKDDEGKRLAKRDGARTIRSLRESGASPDSIVASFEDVR